MTFGRPNFPTCILNYTHLLSRPNVTDIDECKCWEILWLLTYGVTSVKAASAVGIISAENHKHGVSSRNNWIGDRQADFSQLSVASIRSIVDRDKVVPESKNYVWAMFRYF